MSKNNVRLTEVLQFMLGFVGSRDGISLEMTKVLAAVGAAIDVLEENGTADIIILSCVRELANVVGLDGDEVCREMLTWLHEDIEE